MSFEQICVVNTVALISDEMNVSYTELLEKVGVGEDALVAVVENLLRILVQELRVSKSSENLNTVWRLLWIPYFCEPAENPITGNSRYYNLCINNLMLKGIRDKANELYHIRMSEVKDTTVIATEEVKEKKKRAPAKKKAETVASEVTASEVTASEVKTVVTTEEVKEKKKRAPPKKKAEPVTEDAVTIESEVVAEPVSEVKEKKKRAPPKKKEPVSEVVAETVVVSEVKEKKKRAPPKKKADAVTSEVTTSEATSTDVQVTASEVTEVKEKKKRAPPKKKEVIAETVVVEQVTSEATVSEATVSEATVSEATVSEPIAEVKDKKKRAPPKKKAELVVVENV